MKPHLPVHAHVNVVAADVAHDAAAAPVRPLAEERVLPVAVKRLSQVRRRARLALLIVLLLATSVPIGGTAVLYWSTVRGDALYVAADSTVLDVNKKPTAAKVCKIVPGARFVIALSGGVRGRMMSKDPRTGVVTPGQSVDLFDVARQVVLEAQTIEGAAESFGLKAREFLDVVAGERTDDGPLLQLLVAGFQDQKPAYVFVTYSRERDGDGRVVARGRTIVACPPDCAIGNTPKGFGQLDEMLSTDFLTLSPEIVGDPARMADALLTRQMDRRTAEGHDGFIAGPFDVLEITAKGLEWKHCKPQCGQGCPR